MNVSIVGAGLMGRWHAHAARKAGARISSVVDTDIGAATRLARRFGGSAFGDTEAMIFAGRPDVIHICSPKSTHLAIAELALQAGCHLLIEKPMTATAFETEHIYKLAADRHVHVSPAHQYLFQDGVLKAKRLSPAIGRVVDVAAVVISSGGAYSGDEAVQEIAFDILPHPLSLIQRFLPASPSEASWSVLSPRPGELRISAEASGTTASIFVSMNARPTSNFLELRGEHGTIHANLFHGYSFLECAGVSRATKLAEPFRRSLKNAAAAAFNLSRRAVQNEPAYPGLQRLVHSFYQAVSHKTPPPIPAEDVIATAKIRDELIERVLARTGDSVHREGVSVPIL